MSSRAPSILYSIQSESELKERRIISDSTHPRRIFGSIIVFTAFEHIHLRREIRRNYSAYPLKQGILPQNTGKKGKSEMPPPETR